MKVKHVIDLIGKEEIDPLLRDRDKIIETFKVFEGEEHPYNEFKNFLYTLRRCDTQNLNDLFETGQTKNITKLIKNIVDFRNTYPQWDYVMKYLQENLERHKDLNTDYPIRLRQDF